MIIPAMFVRLYGFVGSLVAEPETAADDPALDLLQRGLSVPQVVSALAPGLGGPAIVSAQRAVTDQAVSLIGRQGAKVEQQARELVEWAEYAESLERQIEALEDYAQQLQGVIAAREAEIHQLQATIARMRRGVSE